MRKGRDSMSVNEEQDTDLPMELMSYLWLSNMKQGGICTKFISTK